MNSDNYKIEKLDFALPPYKRNDLKPRELDAKQIMEKMQHWILHFNGLVTDFILLADARALIEKLTEENERLRAEIEASQMFKARTFALMDKIYADYASRCNNNQIFMNGMHAMRCELKLEIGKLLRDSEKGDSNAIT